MQPVFERIVAGFAGSSKARAGWARAERAIIWTCFAATAVIAIWAAPRGFDFLDTGCYFLEYKFPADVADTHTTYHLFARPFFLLVGQSIIGFRYVSWALAWGATGFFAWAWRRHLRALYPAGVIFSSSAAFGAFLLASCAGYTIKPAALTYNSFNFVGVCVALGFLTDGAARLMEEQKSPDWRGIAEIAVAALAATIDLLIKPSTAAFLLAVIVGYCAVSPGIDRRAKRRLAAVAALAAATAVLAMAVFLGGFGALAVRARTLTSILQNDAFMTELNTRTVREFKEIGVFLWHDLHWSAYALGGGTVVLLAFRTKPAWQRRAAVVLGWILFLLWAYATIDAQLWRGSHQLYAEGVVARLYLGATLLAGGAVLTTQLVKRSDGCATEAGRRGARAVLKVLWWLILVATPFAGAYGSTTSIYLNGALYAICWLGALFIAFAELEHRWHAPRLGCFATVPFALYAVAQLYHGQVAMPYMLSHTLWEQTVPTAVGSPATTLLLDPDTSACINSTRQILTKHGFKPGDDIFCFFNIPGLVYAVGGRSPIIPWYFGRIYVNNPVEEIYMQAAGPERRRRAWIITQADVKGFHDHFLRGGINFPDGYEQVGSLMNPQSGLPVGIWKPRATAQ